MLTRLAEDPMQLSRELDWVAKLELLEGYRTRDKLAWSHPRLQLVDLQYSDIRPDRGLYNRLVARGRIERLVTEDEVQPRRREPAQRHPGLLPRPLPAPVQRVRSPPPPGTRSSSTSGRDSLQRVPTLEPLRGTKAHVGELLDRCATAAELVDAPHRRAEPPRSRRWPAKPAVAVRRCRRRWTLRAAVYAPPGSWLSSGPAALRPGLVSRGDERVRT